MIPRALGVLVWEVAVSDKQNSWWDKEFVRPAQLARLHLKSIGDQVDGDAPVENHTTVTPHAASSDLPPPPAAAWTSHANDQDAGLGPINKKQKRLCAAYQRGACAPCAKGTLACPNNSAERHQCAICLGDHPAMRCPSLQKAAGKGGGKEGGGKGKKKGKGGGKGKGQGGKSRVRRGGQNQWQQQDWQQQGWWGDGNGW